MWDWIKGTCIVFAFVFITMFTIGLVIEFIILIHKKGMDMKGYFEYYDVGDKVWRKRPNSLLIGGHISVREWFDDAGIKTRDAK